MGFGRGVGAAGSQLPAQAFNTIQRIKMSVAADYWQTVLHRERADPEIVLGNRPSLLAEILANRRIVDRCFNVDRENNRLLDQEVEETSQTTAITRTRQSIPVLANHNHWQLMPLIACKDFHNRRIAGEQC